MHPHQAGSRRPLFKSEAHLETRISSAPSMCSAWHSGPHSSSTKPWKPVFKRLIACRAGSDRHPAGLIHGGESTQALSLGVFIQSVELCGMKLGTTPSTREPSLHAGSCLVSLWQSIPGLSPHSEPTLDQLGFTSGIFISCFLLLDDSSSRDSTQSGPTLCSRAIPKKGISRSHLDLHH